MANGYDPTALTNPDPNKYGPGSTMEPEHAEAFDPDKSHVYYACGSATQDIHDIIAWGKRMKIERDELREALRVAYHREDCRSPSCPRCGEMEENRHLLKLPEARDLLGLYKTKGDGDEPS